MAAATTFLSTLTAEQREVVQRDFDDTAKARGWSDLPANAVRRNGIGFGDLSDEQEDAALAVMEAALSDQQPEENEPFTLQFGGHHLAYNLTYEGQDVSLSPSLTAVEPPEFAFQGVEYAPLEDQATAASEAVAALTGPQRAEAELERDVRDLVLGPGDDGPFPEEPEGVVVGSLTARQQERVTAMLRARVGDVEQEAADRLIERYVPEYGETRLAWSGSATPGGTRTYIRLDGPSIWIELSNRPGEATASAHPHTVVRDETADYGGG